MRLFVKISLIGACLLTANLGQATPTISSPGTSYLLAQNQTSLEQAVIQVQQQTGGRVLTAETVNQNGRQVHRIKVLLPNGIVRIFNVPAN